MGARVSVGYGSYFCRVGLAKKIEKNKSMVCTIGFIWRQLGEKAYTRRVVREAVTFRERKKNRGSCAECGDYVAASSFRYHMERSKGISLPQTRGVNMGGGGPTTYVVSFLRVLKTMYLPVLGCPVMAHSAWRLQ